MKKRKQFSGIDAEAVKKEAIAKLIARLQKRITQQHNDIGYEIRASATNVRSVDEDYDGSGAIHDMLALSLSGNQHRTRLLFEAVFDHKDNPAIFNTNGVVEQYSLVRFGGQWVFIFPGADGEAITIPNVGKVVVTHLGTPLAQAVRGKKVGDTVHFAGKMKKIVALY